MDHKNRKTKVTADGDAGTDAGPHVGPARPTSQRDEAAQADAQLRGEAWQRENKAAIEAFNRFVEREGIPLSQYRQF